LPRPVRLLRVARVGNSSAVTATRADIEAAWRNLTGAVARRDGPAALAAVGPGQRLGLLQNAGPAALVALGHDEPDAGTAAAGLAEALTARGWDGDNVLAELITATVTASPTGRRLLAVDLDMLGDVLADGSGGWLDLGSGYAWPQDLLDDGALEDILGPEQEPDRWLGIGFGGSHDAWQDMADYVASLADGPAATDLSQAIDGRGAFRRFQKALDKYSDLRVHWRVHSSEVRTGRARAWLADAGYDATP
jgi:Uncharacterised protein family (UPF0158)